jgi:hypothetical protein
MGQLLAFAPTEAALTEAWEAYDVAAVRLQRLYTAGSVSSSRERMNAALEAARLQRTFAALAARVDAAAKAG